ncbi:MAG: hypothetical protein FWE29_05900 [Defluviitaleaceae bacterium]|nr:hypothetical protein [Defluviitaleaceae bacterium]
MCNEKSKDDLTIIEGESITVEHIKQILNLDKLVYDECYQNTLESSMDGFERNSDTYTMLYSSSADKIVAYVLVTAITDEYYDLIKSGRLIDAYLPPEAAVSYDHPGIYNLYFSSVVIHPDYQMVGVLKYLLEAFVEKLISLGDEGFYMKRVVADAVTDKGEKFCSLVGMDRLYESDHNSVIYEMELLPPKFKAITTAHAKFYDYYMEVSKRLFGDRDI